jgi:hypothetical protein
MTIIGVGDGSFGNTDDLGQHRLDPPTDRVALDQQQLELVGPQPF